MSIKITIESANMLNFGPRMPSMIGRSIEVMILKSL
jgi:hypothetical protein